MSDAARNGPRGGSKPAPADVSAPRIVGQRVEPAAGAGAQAGDAPPDRTVAAFVKNHREEVRARLVTWRGRQLADLRAYYCGQDGEMRPGVKGLTLDRALLPELEAAVIALRAAAELEAAA